MIILYHDGTSAIEYKNTQTNVITKCNEKNIQKSMFSLSNEFKNSLLIWCHQNLKDFINEKKIKNIFHHELILASYSLNGEYVLSKEIGFVDQHCFINIKQDVLYPTWLMSSNIGGINSNVLIKFKEFTSIKQSFDEFLCSLAKIGMPKGLLCYSEPNLLISKPKHVLPKFKNKKYLLFKFVKKHYKVQWVFILLLNYLLYNKQFPFVAFVKSLWGKKDKTFSTDFSDLQVKSIKESIVKDSFKVDVLIPTLGRKEHLFNVLKDLSQQTLLPNKVIIVEQNGLEGSVSELNYLVDNDWPFKIDHTFIHQLGACNARNIALSKVTGNWVFFADDDVRFDNDLLKSTFAYIHKYKLTSVTISCLQRGEIEKNKELFQWVGFGSGTSIVKSTYVHKCSFKPEHEFGYGEDTDYGMQLKNLGCDTIYLPFVKMLHLKAPIGGFRHKFMPKWSNDKIQPKPSPTVMAYHLKHLTKEQLNGYKIILFIKFYKRQSIKNPIVYLKSFNKRWKVSINWAKKMMENEV
ncbi:glycosyltransferase family 2 protein [Polaribacter sargassicola]|uniref:glycosyltransferase family 2 protein n=1 Tax=Polaribacter sargassicola TaxID=2836891 RepID=UPI001F458894|nr:glycosyltransferase family A protein [Polaribacter sp. DS7-9]MCG1036611.1 glycosyltransferase family 2 protein [Polaribacter sp. DS7-9]